MNTSIRTLPILSILAITVASCGSMRTASVGNDDVYYMPSDAPLTASVNTTPQATQQAPKTVTPVPEEDYYNPNTAAQYAPSNYYDMAYNDPYYYNYGRFGFGSPQLGMGYGMGSSNFMMGFSFGSGMYNGWSSGYGAWGNGINGYGSPYGFGNPYGYGSQFGGGWNSPFYDPWYNGYGYGGYGSGFYGNGYGGYGGYGNGFYGNGIWGGGYGPYYGPYGGSCIGYQPVVVGGSSGTVIGHRLGMGGVGGTNSTAGNYGRKRGQYRDPIGLRNSVDNSTTERTTTRPSTPYYPNTRTTLPAQQPSIDKPSRTRENAPRTSPSRNNGQRTSPSHNERNNSGTSGGSFGGSNSGSGSGTGSGSRGGGGGRPREL